MIFSEDSRVKIPCILHLMRLGYRYLSLKGATWDEATNIFPRFKQSQINVFVEDQRGEGIQHLALLVKDIVPAVKAMRATKGLDFLSTPAAYYDYLPERIEKSGIKRIDENLAELRDLQILIDGHKEHQYLLQIFMKEKSQLLEDREAGPFFYEIIERKGDKGFGGGNFKALFESIERAQVAERAKTGAR